MTRAYLAFTETGLALAKRLSAALPGSVARCGQDGVSLAEWASAQFVQSDALIFVGAAGIAVRAPLQEQDYRPGCGSGGRMRAVCRAHSVRTSGRRERSCAGHCRCMRSRACDYHRHRCPRHFCGGRVGKAPKLHGTASSWSVANYWPGSRYITGLISR